MTTAHGLIVNEREEMARMIESRLEGLDAVAACIEQLGRGYNEEGPRGDQDAPR